MGVRPPPSGAASPNICNAFQERHHEAKGKRRTPLRKTQGLKAPSSLRDRCGGPPPRLRNHRLAPLLTMKASKQQENFLKGSSKGLLSPSAGFLETDRQRRQRLRSGSQAARVSPWPSAYPASIHRVNAARPYGSYSLRAYYVPGRACLQRWTSRPGPSIGDHAHQKQWPHYWVWGP